MGKAARSKQKPLEKRSSNLKSQRRSTATSKVQKSTFKAHDSVFSKVKKSIVKPRNAKSAKVSFEKATDQDELVSSKVVSPATRILAKSKKGAKVHMTRKSLSKKELAEMQKKQERLDNQDIVDDSESDSEDDIVMTRDEVEKIKKDVLNMYSDDEEALSSSESEAESSDSEARGDSDNGEDEEEGNPSSEEEEEGPGSGEEQVSSGSSDAEVEEGEDEDFSSSEEEEEAEAEEEEEEREAEEQEEEEEASSSSKNDEPVLRKKAADFGGLHRKGADVESPEEESESESASESESESEDEESGLEGSDKDEEEEEEEEESDEELILNVKNAFSEDEDQEEEEGEEEVKNLGISTEDLPKVYRRIQKVLEVLKDFKERRNPEIGRHRYLEQFKEDLMTYFGYNEFLTQLLLNLFAPAECLEYMEAQEMPRPLTIRANTLRMRRRDLAQTLISRGVNLDPIGKWSKEGLQIFDTQVPIGATPEYLWGCYIIQSAASLLPVMALQPEPTDKVLDMCAAPGVKTTHIAALMSNQGVLVANDISKPRTTALVSNLQRLGVTNTLVTSCDGRRISAPLGGFERILLDAPCTGLGIVSRDKSIKQKKDSSDIDKCVQMQKELVLKAIDVLKPGGTLVYSTCTVSVEENEAVVDYARRNRKVKVIETGLEFGVKGIVNYCGKHFHPSIAKTMRYYPHKYNMDGFYVAKLVKVANMKKEAEVEEAEDLESLEQSEEEEEEEVPKVKKDAKLGKRPHKRRDAKSKEGVKRRKAGERASKSDKRDRK